MKIKLILGFLFFLFLLSFASSAYTESNSKFIGPQVSSFLGGETQEIQINSETCNTGQDFLVQIAPGGCSPSVVRSDLLEEQNVPVFCKIQALKINPAVRIVAIESISFGSSYPDGVSTISFLPTYSALGLDRQLTGTGWNDIGYAVIYLEGNEVESSLPDFVSGNLKARIRYTAIDAFGSVDRTFYLPLLSDAEFDEREGQYSFFNNMGYLRADDIGDDYASVSIYSGLYERSLFGATASDEKQKILTRNMDVGETSSPFFLPGFGCFASSYLRLDAVEGADTRAVLRVNSEVFEIKRGETFLNGLCRITDDPVKEGLRENVKISCRSDDEGTKSFILRIEPTIKLKIGGVEKEYKTGDWLYTYEDKNIYLGYVGTTPQKNNIENSLVYLVTVPGPKMEKLDDGTLKSVARVAENKLRSDKSISDIAKSIFGVLAKSFEWVFDGNNYKLVQYGFPEPDAFGQSVEIVSFGVGTNLDFNNQTLDGYYGSAVRDYERVKDNFGNEKYPEGSEYVLGEKSLKELIDLSNYLQQREDLKRYCDLFKTNYPNSKLDVSPCEGIPKYFNEGVSSKTILIGGDYKLISFEGINLPQFEEYGIELTIRQGNEVINEPLKLTKGDIIYLDSLFGENQNTGQIYSIPNAISGNGRIYFKYSYNVPLNQPIQSTDVLEWLWSADQINWMDTRTSIVNGGNFNNQKPTTPALQLISRLSGKSFESGREIILEASGTKIEEYLIFNEIIDSEHASIKLNLENKSAIASAGVFLTSNDYLLELDHPYNVGGTEYVFVINKINLKKVAKVSVHTQIRESSEIEFNFNVGIEKRSIQLSPGQIRSQIESTKALTEKLESISNTLGTVVDTMQAVCVATSAALTVKNLIFNSGVESYARKLVMNGEKGWYEFCADKVRLGNYGSVEECLFENSENIENQVDQMSEIMSEQNELLSNLESEPGVINEGGFLGQDVVVQENLVNLYAPEVTNSLPASLTNPDDETQSINMTKARSSLDISRFRDGVYNVEDLREIELYSKLYEENPSDPLYKKRLYTALSQLNVNSDNRLKLDEAANFDNINPNDITILTVGKEAKVSQYGNRVASDFGNRGFTSGLSGTTPVQKIYTTKGDIYYAVLEEKISGQFNIKRDETGIVVYAEDGTTRVPQETLQTESKEIFQLSFKRYDSTSYNTPIKNPEIKYYENEPYKGLLAVVPFDVDNGWYAYIPQSTSITQTRSFDDSAKINSFWLCNAGSNGIMEYNPIGDDEICELINLGTGQPYNQFPGLENQDAINLVSDAVRAIETASRAHRDGVRNVNVGGKTIPVGSPALDLPILQCTDVMSPTDCQILFNACDPVICPSSRCDFGGDYPVRDVIQSGIVGSIALCLPNWNEGIYVPVCLTGVKAGLDGFISVTESYSECLETSLNEGKTVGICDEIYSIYGCELLWRTAIPIVQLTIPKLDSLIFGGGARGGGEYIGGIQGALNNAQNSIDFFTQSYAVNSFDAFKARSQDEVGTAVCKNFISIAYPEYAGGLNMLSQADSPPQFTANFETIPFSSATNPPQVQYKVFFHIFAGNDVGAYYQVYLRTDGSSFYQLSPTRLVDSGYISVGKYETETIDFTGPEGYKELCVRVNNFEECGFGSVTTDFALNYLRDQYIQAEANTTDIRTQGECISGGPNLYNLLGLNIQEGFSDLVDPSLYNEGIIRVCASENPGSGNVATFETSNQRWIEVGYCGDQNVKCWIDTESIARSVNFEITADETLESLTATLIENLKNQKGLLSEDEFLSKLNEIESETDFIKKISLIELIYDKVFENNKKGYLLFLEGNAFGELAKPLYNRLVLEGKINVAEETTEGDGPVTPGSTGATFTSSKYELSYGDVLGFIGGTELCFQFFEGIWHWRESCDDTFSNTPLGLPIGRPTFTENKWNLISEGTTNLDSTELSIVSGMSGDYISGLSNLINKASSTNTNFFQANPQLAAGSTVLNREGIFEVSGPSISIPRSPIPTSSTLYFEYSLNKWTWGSDGTNWYDVSTTSVSSRNLFNSEASTYFDEIVNFLKRKNLPDGASYLFEGKNTPVFVGPTTTNLGGCSNYYSDIKTIANEKNVDPYLILAIMYQESYYQGIRCNPLADSGSSVGLMQINTGVWCGEHGLPSDKNECELLLKADATNNIRVGTQILSDYYTQYRNGVNFNGCDVQKTYTGWEAAIRAYNGLGCNENYPQQDYYVDNVVELWNQFKSQNVLDGGQTPTTTSTSTNIGEKILEIAMTYVRDKKDTYKIENGVEVYSYVCSTFTSQVLIDAGALPEFSECEASSTPILQRNERLNNEVYPFNGFLEVYNKANSNSNFDLLKDLQKGDVVIWGCNRVNNPNCFSNEFQHSTIFSRFTSENGGGWIVVGDPGDIVNGVSRPPQEQTYYKSNENNWYITHVWRSTKDSSPGLEGTRELFQKAIAEVKNLNGDYSDNLENRNFVERIYVERLITLDQYNDIKGTGGFWSFLNAEEDMRFVEETLIDNFANSGLSI